MGGEHRLRPRGAARLRPPAADGALDARLRTDRLRDRLRRACPRPASLDLGRQCDPCEDRGEDALVIWLVASGAFAFYTSRFGSYNKTWGSLAAVVVMLTWLWLSSVALLLGAEVNAEAERSRELRRGEPAEVALQAPAKA
ncbi:MAG: YihY/virulence factor BrkB family protein [Actinobacteria bacterium]|nr:MAG: YihY/virulence factor BrkB family protein [Actinomycetota bacterium]